MNSSPQPPPFPRAGPSVHHVSAIASILCGPALLVVGGLLFAIAPDEDAKHLLIMLIPLTLLILLLGILAGIIALFGIPSHGAKSLLLPALIGITLSAAISLALLVFTAFYAARGKVSQSANLDIQSLMETDVRTVNQDAPIMLDSSRRVDGAALLSDKTVAYDFTLVNLSASDIDPTALRLGMYPAHRENYRTSPGNAPYREHEVTLVYRYHDTKGVFVTEIRITPHDDSDSITKTLLKDYLDRHVAHTNSTAPLPAGPGVRLDHCEKLGERSIRYDYTLTEVTLADTDPDVIQKQMRRGLLDSYKKDPQLDLIRINEVTLVYRFKDRNGASLGETTIGPDHLN
jgi:hypothetical protein